MIEYLEKRIKDRFNEVFFQTIDNQSITFGQFFTFAKCIANNWEVNGLKSGERIAFRVNNSLALLASYLACAIGGYTAVPIPLSLNKKNADLILSKTKPVLILDEPPLLKTSYKLSNNNEIKFHADPGYVFCIMFSSGTTGIPKGICLSFDRMIGSAMAFGRLSGYDFQTRLYHILPMLYMAGLMNAFLAPFISGSRIIEGPEFSLSQLSNFWERPVKNKVNAMVLFPIIASTLCRLARDKELAIRNAKNLRIIQCTGNLLTEELREKFIKIFDKPLQDCYGITELGGGLSMQTRIDAISENNSGKLIPELKCRLINYSENQKELWISSPYMMEGYLDEKNDKDTLDDNGFFNTGDLAAIINDKLTITGRSKDIIIRGAENISPEIIKKAIINVDGVDEVYVLGIPHKYWGELVVACVVPSNKGIGQNLVNIINDSISKILLPEYLPNKVVIVDNFPRSISGTIQKKLLIEMIINE